MSLPKATPKCFCACHETDVDDITGCSLCDCEPVLMERERCAKIAESCSIPGHLVVVPLVAGIAKKIRDGQE